MSRPGLRSAHYAQQEGFPVPKARRNARKRIAAMQYPKTRRMRPRVPPANSRRTVRHTVATAPQVGFKSQRGVLTARGVGRTAPTRRGSPPDCPTRMITDLDGAKNRTECFCNDGYILGRDDVCVDCPRQANCTRGKAITMAGYWKPSPNRGKGDGGSYYQCEETLDESLTACLYNGTCSEGNRGPLCASCRPAHFKRIGQPRCEACFENTALSVLFLLGVFAAAMLVIAINTVLTIRGKSGCGDIIAKIGLNY